ncbi:MAG: hypothetical protein RL272_391, partial [Candidatus Parcubacteria bacterium]
MYASVIPALRLPRQLTGPFDYAVPEALSGAVRRGSIVLVPWRGRKIAGLVVAMSGTPGIDKKDIKPIAGVASAERAPDDLIETFSWMAEHYVASPATVVKCFVPDVPKRAIMKEPRAADGVRPAKKGEFYGAVVRYATPDEKTAETHALAAATLGAGKGVIIAVPHHDDVAPTVAGLRAACGDDAVLEFHGDMTMTALWKSWTAAASGRPLAVVGTRMAVGAPVARLGAIIVHECDSGDLKQYDQNPRYDARAVALHRAKQAGAQAVLMSHGPRAEEYALAVREGFSWKEGGNPSIDAVLAEPGRGAKSAEERLLTVTALEAAEKALHSGKKVLLFHNRRGTATAMICRDCGRIERCATCAIPLRVHADKLHCHRCNRIGAAPLTCKGCGGPSFRTWGMGTGAVTPILAAAFPDAKVVQADADTRLKDVADADIAVGTQFLLHAVAETASASRYGAVIVTSADDLLGHPGFRATENAWRTVRTLADVAAAAEGTLVLQTLDGESPAIRRLLTAPKAFLAEELEARDRAGFPPKSALVTVTTVGRTEDEAKGKIAALAKRLRADLGTRSGAAVTGPHRPGNPFRHG